MSEQPSPASGAALEAPGAGQSAARGANATLDAEWDAFLRGAPGGDQVQSSGWAEVKRLSGMTAFRAIVRRGDRIVAGAQVLTRVLPILGRVGYVPYGPVCEDDDPALVSAALGQLMQCMRDQQIRALIVQPPAGGEAVSAMLEAQGHTRSPLEIAPTATLRTSLEGDLDELLAKMRSSTRRNIKRTERAGVTFRELAPSEVGTFYKLHRASAARQAFEPMPLARVQEQLDVLGPEGGVRMFVVELEGETLGGELFGCFGSTVTSKLPGFAPGGTLRPTDLLMWETMRWAAQQGYRWFDFGGVPRGYAQDLIHGIEPGEDPRRSAAEFKRGFRGDPLLFPEPYIIIPNPALRVAFRFITSQAATVRWVRALVNRLRRV